MIQTIKDILQKKRKRFVNVCKNTRLNLSYKRNKDSLPILEDIFVNRAYADYFPFYENATIVDIGAHYGYFSIFASKNTDKASIIYALEPSETNFGNLKENLSDNEVKNVKPFQIAIGRSKGTEALYEGSSENYSLIKNYPLLKKGQNKALVKTLDLGSFISENEIDSIDFLKLDCEGAEYSILLNAPSDVLNKIMVISMEFHDLKDREFTGNKLVEKLKENNFNIVKYTYCKTNLNLNYGKLIATKASEY